MYWNVFLSSNIDELPYCIKLVDTDLKRISKLPYWFQLDQRIVKHAIGHPMNKVCKEIIDEAEQTLLHTQILDWNIG